MNSIDSYLKSKTEEHTNKIIRVMKYVGEMTVNEARTNKTYQDRTANLRNSTGYVIVVNGKVISENFKNSASAAAETDLDGKKIGRDFAHSLASNYPDIALIVVAGMNYAAYVESKGFNVITSAEQLAKVKVPMLLKQLVIK